MTTDITPPLSRICNRCNKQLADDVLAEMACENCGGMEFRWVETEEES